VPFPQLPKNFGKKYEHGLHRNPINAILHPSDAGHETTNWRVEMSKSVSADAKAVVIDADGFFGSRAVVWFSGTVAQCRAFAKRKSCQVIANCEKSKGDTIFSGVLSDMISSGVWSVVR
jgi:hypothetical protein